MNTRSISWGKGGRCVRLTTYHHPVPLSRNLGTLTSWNLLGPSGPVIGLLMFVCVCVCIYKQHTIIYIIILYTTDSNSQIYKMIIYNYNIYIYIYIYIYNCVLKRRISLFVKWQ